MKVFEDIDIEFFDPMIDSPKHKEEIIIVLKNSNDAPPRYYPTSIKGEPLLLFATFKKNMTVPSRYIDKTGFSARSYPREQIKCWGRLKRN